MPLKSNNDGTYEATWVPSESGSYLIQIFIDSCSTGNYDAITVGGVGLASSHWFCDYCLKGHSVQLLPAGLSTHK